MTDLLTEGRRIARGLLELDFPASEFHHREHCLASACLIIDQPDTDWEQELPSIIRRYNLAMGGTNTDEAGYHETLTQFFLGEIRRFLAAHAALASRGGLSGAARLAHRPQGPRAYLLHA